MSRKRPDHLGVNDGRLAACPPSPNCVSTFETDSEHGIEPIPYEGASETARARLVSVIESMPRTKIVTNNEDYVYAEFTSATWRFVDDVEFLIDDENKLIHFRSASRLGHSDMGVNRARMETIRKKFLEP